MKLRELSLDDQRKVMAEFLASKKEGQDNTALLQSIIDRYEGVEE